MSAGIEMSLYIGQRVRHQDYQGKRVTGVVRGLTVDTDRGLMVSCVLDAPIVIPAGEGYRETCIHHQYAPAHEFAPFDDRDELIAEMLAALEGVVRVADRATVEFDAARAAIVKAKGGRQ
jgi:hypothetical protein